MQKSIRRNIEVIKEYSQTGKMPPLRQLSGQIINPEEICIIIPTHNRQDRLPGCMEYYRPLGCRIIICDSSETPLEWDQNMNSLVTYFHRPGVSFTEKILLGLQAAGTPWTAVTADDDFILWDALAHGAAFLKKHPSYVFFSGRYLSLRPGPEPTLQPLYESYDYMTSYHSAGPAVRAARYFRNYYITLWGLFRVPALQKAYESLFRANPGNQNYYEIIAGASLLFQGPVKVTPQLWGVREGNAAGTWGSRFQRLSESLRTEAGKNEAAGIAEIMDSITAPGYFMKCLEHYLKGRAPSVISRLKLKLNRLMIKLFFA